MSVEPAVKVPVPTVRTGAARWTLARAALITAVLTVAGALLGLGRDRALAHFFGAGSETDAFLVAWTVPEVAATLLIEDGMAFVLVPAFSLALARRGTGSGSGTGTGTGTGTGSGSGSGKDTATSLRKRKRNHNRNHNRGRDPVSALVAASLPRLLLGLAAAGALLIAGAPLLVHALAPGLPEPDLAVDCTRLTGTCAISFGLAGYCSAALRAHRSFAAPAAIYIAYNIGIIAAMAAFADRLGVRAAALGVACGGCLMVAVQAPSLWRALRRREHAGTEPPPTPATPTVPAPPAIPVTPATPTTPATCTTPGTRTEPAIPTAPPERTPVTAGVEAGLVACVLLFALCRQSQVLVERYLASGLPPGAISHLNYAQKVAQMPMALSLMLCTVTFPVVARALAEGDTARARERMERDLLLAGCVVLLGAAALVACAPALLQLLFQQGAFTARDTAATAGVLRVYALGLLGHTLVGALVRCHFSAGRRTWHPLAAMAVGALATAALGAWAAGPWGVRGIAAANAAGITLTALLLLVGRPGRGGRSSRTGLDALLTRAHPSGRSTATGTPHTPHGTDRTPAPRPPVNQAHRQTTVPIRARRVLTGLAEHVLAAVLAAGAGLGCGSWAGDHLTGGPLGELAVSYTAVAVVYGLVLAALHPRTATGTLRAALRPARQTLHRVPGAARNGAVRRSHHAPGPTADRTVPTADRPGPTASTAPTDPTSAPPPPPRPGARPPAAPESTRILTGKHPHVR